jgi:hypothetical protein
VPTNFEGSDDDGSPNQTPPADGSPPPTGEAGPVLTVEDVEAQWRHRVSQKDKAHAAAEQALREENDRLRRQVEEASRSRSAGQSGSGGGNAGATDDYYRDELAKRDREIEEERRLRAIEAKRGKYPALAKQVGESGSGVFGYADEATLARLNALADDETDGGSLFAPTTPRRAAPAKPKSLNEMTKAELEAELQRAVGRGLHNR